MIFTDEPGRPDFARRRMPILTSDAPVALEHLDDHMKAILKVKLREFVHLSPCFENIPSIDVARYASSGSSVSSRIPRYIPESTPLADDCPNTRHRSMLRRRPLRPLVV